VFQFYLDFSQVRPVYQTIILCTTGMGKVFLHGQKESDQAIH